MLRKFFWSATLTGSSAALLFEYPRFVDFFTFNAAKYNLIDPEKASLEGDNFLNRFLSTIATIRNYNHDSIEDRKMLETTIWSQKISSPVGLAAGLDKNAFVIAPMLRLGFGAVEIGSVTPEPQNGNPQPRLFRLVEDRAIINRMGFNSLGAKLVREQLEKLRNLFPKYKVKPSRDRDLVSSDKTLLNTVTENPQQDNNCKPKLNNFLLDFVDSFSCKIKDLIDLSQLHHRGLVGVSLGKNKTSRDASSDYISGLNTLGPYADYLVINVSSPNTPNLRDLQKYEDLEKLLNKFLASKNSNQFTKDIPIAVKIAPDINDEEKKNIANLILKYHIDGLIISNTTTSRPEFLISHHKDETGGLSGSPLKEMSCKLLKEMYRLTDGKVVLIGVGGIESGNDVYERIRAGATLIQLYTAMAYFGPGIVERINSELAYCLKRDGFKHVKDAIGVDVRK